MMFSQLKLGYLASFASGAFLMFLLALYLDPFLMAKLTGAYDGHYPGCVIDTAEHSKFDEAAQFVAHGHFYSDPLVSQPRRI